MSVDVDKARKDLQQAFDDGFQSLSVCLMHSYTYSAHEEIIDRLAREIGFEQISISSKLMPMCKIVPRGHSATADAYLTPEIRKYIEGFESGFEDLANSGCRCEFMQSDGGLVEFRR
jgi:5-oxoprolinase (ATP-hydrolysing)